MVLKNTIIFSKRFIILVITKRKSASMIMTFYTTIK